MAALPSLWHSPAMRSRDTAIVVVPGLGDSGPDHWQSRWEAKLPSAARVVQASWSHPEKAAWVAAIREVVAAADKPVVVLAHSLGVIATVAMLTDPGAPPVAGAFLVAPPSAEAIAALPEVDPAFRPYPTGPLPCPAVVVGSRSDPYSTVRQVEDLALDWGARFVDAGEAGHINADSGHGPWPEGLMTFAGFLSKL